MGGAQFGAARDTCRRRNPLSHYWFDDEPPKRIASKDGKPVTGYVDGCFDLMHSGHFNAIRQAAGHCDRLIVGIHSDDEIGRNKGPPVMNQEERYAMMKHIKWAGEIAYDVPYSPAIETLDRVGADYCFHGDDMPVNSSGVGAYDVMRDAGRLMVVKRTEGVSTTDFIGRLLSLTTEHHEHINSPQPTRASAMKKDDSEIKKEIENMASLSSQGIKLLASTRRIAEFSKPHRTPTEDDVVVYVDGTFDLFHIGHASTLEKAKALGTFLIVGIHDDATVNRTKGANYPIATLNERVLCVCACKHVDEVIVGAPLEITKDMIHSLNIKYVAIGDHSDKPFREPGYTTDVIALKDTEKDPYRIPKSLDIVKIVKSDFPYLTTATIAERVASRRLQYLKRNADRGEREATYYAEKDFKAEK